MDISKSKNFFKSFKKVDVVYHLASVVGVQNYIKDTKNLIYTMFYGTDNIINYCKKIMFFWFMQAQVKFMVKTIMFHGLKTGIES